MKVVLYMWWMSFGAVLFWDAPTFDLARCGRMKIAEKRARGQLENALTLARSARIRYCRECSGWDRGFPRGFGLWYLSSSKRKVVSVQCQPCIDGRGATAKTDSFNSINVTRISLIIDTSFVRVSFYWFFVPHFNEGFISCNYTPRKWNCNGYYLIAKNTI